LIRIVTQSLKILSVLVVGIVIVGGSFAFFDYWTGRQDDGSNGEPVQITITDDDDTGSVAEKLADADLIRWTLYFESRMRLAGDEIAPGTYTLRKGMSTSDIIAQITVDEDGNSNAPVQEADEEGEGDDNALAATQELTFTFIEGQRIEEFAVTAEESGLPGGRQAFLDAAGNRDNWAQWSFLSEIPDDGSLEGYLFPDTYTLSEGQTADDLIYKMLANFDAKFTTSMRSDAEAAGLAIRDVVIIASIVEREAAVSIERPTVAAVYLNRVEAEMSLGADPVLQYNVGDQGDGNWWPTLDTELIELGKSQGFNAYDEVGLPPYPISNPGIASLQAVIQPDDVTYLYFVAKNDGSGEHVFADTLEEQEQNICEWNPEYETCGGSGSLIDPNAVVWREDVAA
jgi:UPF0755 protein